jgi:hypothetical protein
MLAPSLTPPSLTLPSLTLRSLLDALPGLVLLSALLVAPACHRAAPPSSIVGAQPDGARGPLARFPGAQAFVSGATPAFRRELLGEPPMSPGGVQTRALGELCSLLADPSVSGLPPAEADAFLTAALGLLAAQTSVNPEKYVSHGADHSVRVMDWASRLHDALPEVRAGLAARYHGTRDQGRLALLLAALLHDVGYADLGEHKVKKWLHAPAGAKMLRALLDNRGWGAQLGAPSVAADIVRAVAEHNLDDGRCQPAVGSRCQATLEASADAADPRSATTPLLRCDTPCDDAVVRCTAPCTYSRAFVTADAGADPLSFVVRLADNLDATFDRLTPPQQQVATQRYLLRLHADAALRAAAVAHDDAAAERARRRIQRETPGLPAGAAEADMLVSANAETFLHFYSNWIVSGMSFSHPGERLLLSVEMRGDVPADLAFRAHPGVGLYQINRLATASAALTLGGRPLLAQLDVRILAEAPGISPASAYPLRAFTRQLAHSPAGPGAPLCGDSCVMGAALTLSAEPCLDEASSPTPCPAALEGMSPFSDFSFPTR